MLRAIGPRLFIALLLISPFCWATDHILFRTLLRRKRGCSSQMLTALASEPSRSRVRWTTIPHGLRVVIGLCLRRSVPARSISIAFTPMGLALSG